MAHDDTIERTSIITYALLDHLHQVLARPSSADDVSLGMIMGLAMFMDEQIGPMRSERLLSQAPAIVLKTDAHVTPEQINRFADVMRVLGESIVAASADFEPKGVAKVL